MKRSLLLQAIFALALLLLNASSVGACPNCKEAVAAQPAEVAAMARGFNYSVLFMLAVPFSLFSTGAFVVARAVKRGTMPEM